MAGEQQPGRRRRQDLLEQPLALNQGLLPQVLAVQPEEIEGIEVGIAAAIQKLIEERLAVLAQTDQLAVNHRIENLNVLPEPRREVLERFVDVIAA
jgi:hypothetical protein